MLEQNEKGPECRAALGSIHIYWTAATYFFALNRSSASFQLTMFQKAAM